jgi:hypothetical protein
LFQAKNHFIVTNNNLRSSTLKIVLIIFTLSSGVIFKAHSQKEDSTELANLSAELDALFANEEDSLGLMSLIDSLLSNNSSNESFLSMRLGYSNRVTSAGRSFGIDQQGLMPGLSYYHKSGLYTDVTGIWNSELDPKYFATITSAGYLGQFNKKWSYSLSYDHTFFNTTNEYDSYSLTNALNSSVTLDLGPIYTGVDYSYSFGGGETSNRIIWNLTGKIKKRTFKPFNNVTFYPSFSILFGNQNLLLEYYDVNRENRLSSYTIEDINRLADRNDWTDRKRQRTSQLVNILNSDRRTPLQQQFLESYFATQEEVNYFGVLNYYISLPVSFTTKKFGVLISYNYNIPQELNGSEYSSESNGYFGFALTYNLGF